MNEHSDAVYAHENLPEDFTPSESVRFLAQLLYFDMSDDERVDLLVYLEHAVVDMLVDRHVADVGHDLR
jgi:hypothetical protein